MAQMDHPDRVIAPATVHPPGGARRPSGISRWTRGRVRVGRVAAAAAAAHAAAAAAATTRHRTDKADVAAALAGGGGEKPAPLPTPPPPGFRRFAVTAATVAIWRHGNPPSTEVRKSSSGESWATPPRSLAVRTLGEKTSQLP